MNKKEQRKLLYKIMEKEIIENELNIMPYCFGSIRYYNSKYFKNNIKKSLKLSSTAKLLDALFKPFISRGVFDYQDKEIVVFYDKIPIYENIIYNLQTVFHEIFHGIDENGKANMLDEYTKFADECDKFIIDTAPYIEIIKYTTNNKIHDSYMFEILANLYGVIRTYKYIKDNNIKCSEFEIKTLNKLKEKYYKQYLNYDLSKSLNTIIEDYKNNLKYEDFDSTIFEFFLTDKGIVKDINAIFSNEKVLKLDPRILVAFIKTDKVSEAIENTNLNEKTIGIIEQLLNSKNKNEESNNIVLK